MASGYLQYVYSTNGGNTWSEIQTRDYEYYVYYFDLKLDINNIHLTWTAYTSDDDGNYDYRIYEKFIVQYKKLLDTSDKYNDAWFKENYGNEWQQKKKASLALIRSDSSANSVSIIKLKEMCDELNSNSEKYINEGKETFLDDIGIMARAVRGDLPKCAEEKKNLEKARKRLQRAEEKLRESMYWHRLSMEWG